MRIVVALGGNALLRRGERPDADVQRRHVDDVAPALARVAAEHELVVVHGNGPQVGLLALETGADPSLATPFPLGDLVAETQGLIGLWIQQALRNAGVSSVVTLVTQAVVDAGDPAFGQPRKFIGPAYDEEAARELADRKGWTVRRDGSGWRRVAASPRPVRLVEVETARLLLEQGHAVVFAGGGGVPVVEEDGALHAVEGVVDKDHAACLAAITLGADRFVVLTDVAAVMRDFDTSPQPLGRSTPAELEQLSFPEGSMGPKVAAACEFVRATGQVAAIGSLDALDQLLAGTTGTQVVPGDSPAR